MSVCPSGRPVVRPVVRLVVCGSFVVFVFVFNILNTRDDYYYYNYYQCGGPAPRCIYPHTVVRRTPVGSSKYYMSVCMYVCLSVSLSLCLSISPYLCLPVSQSSRPHRFLEIICTARNCTQRMWPQATGSNPLSGSIIFLSVHPSGLPQAIHDFFIYINFQCGGPVLRCIYSHTGVWKTPVGSSQDYRYVCISVCIPVSLSVSLSLCLVVHVAFWRS